MKIAIATIAALVGIAATGSAFAQQAQTVSPTAQQQWAANQSQAPKTRAQVYRSMVHAEQDGQTARLNKLYYGRP